MLVMVTIQPVQKCWQVKKHLECHNLVTVCALIDKADVSRGCEPRGPIWIARELLGISSL